MTVQHRSRLPGWLVLALALLAAPCAFATPRVPSGSGLQNVLFISSYEAGSADTAAVIEAFRTGMEAAGHRTEVFLEALDVYRLKNSPAEAADIEGDLARRYEGIRFDLIIAQASQAVGMAVRFRDEHSPSTPVYCFDNIDEGVIARYSKAMRVYGRPQGMSLMPTLRLASTLFPKARKAIFLATVEDPAYVRAFLDNLDSLVEGFPGLDFVPVINADFATVEEVLAGAGRDSFAIFLTGGWVLPNGDFLTGTKMVDRLSSAFPIPYFGVSTSVFGTGLVGGCLVDRAAMGREACEMALDLIYGYGEPVPWLYSGTSMPTLDWRALRRFGVSAALVPAEARLLFMPESFWLRNQRPLMAAGLLLIVLTILLAALILFRWKKNLFLRENNERLEATVLERTEELRTANTELGAANANLEQSLRRIEGMQERLVSDTQDSVLGRIALGLAHEVNNPLGAIKASAASMRTAMDRSAGGVVTAICSFSPEELSLFVEVLSKTSNDSIEDGLESADVARKSLEERLRSLGLAERAALADLLADAGLGELPDSELLRIAMPRNAGVLDCLYRSRSVERGIEITIEATERIAAIVESLRSYARGSMAGTGDTSASVTESIRQAISFFGEAMRTGIDLELDLEQDIPPVAVPHANLVRVWTNLIRNAIQAMDGEGRLSIKARVSGSLAIVDVIDSGPGVEPSIEERLFIPFASSSGMERGMGLGLSICKRIVEGPGGSIQHCGRDGQTVFTVSLPLAEERHDQEGDPHRR